MTDYQKHPVHTIRRWRSEGQLSDLVSGFVQCVDIYSLLCIYDINNDKIQWASYQIRKIAGFASAGNAGNVFPMTDFKWSHQLTIPVCIRARASRAVIHARIASPRWQGKRSRCMGNPQCYVSGKRPMVLWPICPIIHWTDGSLVLEFRWCAAITCTASWIWYVGPITNDPSDNWFVAPVGHRSYGLYSILVRMYRTDRT